MIKKILFFLSFLFITSNVIIAQTDYFEIPDSLKLKTSKELMLLSNTYRNKDIDRAILYTKTLLQFAINTNDEKMKQYAHLHIALNADIKGDHETAIRYTKLCLTYFKKDKRFIYLEFDTHSLLGRILEQLGKDKAATANFLAAQAIAEKLENPKLLSSVTRNLGKMKRKAGRFEDALADYKKANYIYPKRKSYMGIGGSYLKLNQPDSAIVYSNKGLQKALHEENTLHTSYYYIDIGIAYFLKQNYSASLKNLQSAKSLIHNEKRLVEVYYYIGNCYYLLGRYDDSIKILKQALQIIEDNNIQSQLNFVPYEYSSILELLTDNYHKKNDDETYEYYHSEYKKSIASYQKQKNSVNDLIYTTQIKKEKQRNEANEYKYSRLKQFTFFLLIILLLSYIYFLFRAQKKKVIFKELIQKMEILENNESKAIEKATLKKEVIITDQKTTEILARLQKFELQEFYLDPNCNLRFVAKKVKTNATYLTKIIHTYKEKNFIDYINHLRITYTLKRLNDDAKFRAYSVKSIAHDIGYKSADSFAKHFKKHTKLYPSYYIKTLNKQI